MQEILSLLLIAIALSMDTFSVSLSLGTANIPIEKGIFLSIAVGIMHFIMPILGMLIGNIILKIIPFEHDFLVGIIFLTLSFKMIYDIFFEKEDTINLNYFGIFLFSISVSFDAFTTGIGLLVLTSNILLATFIFMITSFTFTIVGITLGKYVNQKIGKISSIMGVIILLIMALYLII